MPLFCNGVGNLTRDPELRDANGRPVCELRVAFNNGPERKPTYITIPTFDKVAEACATHLAKGRQVYVNGRVLLDEWEAKDGSKRSEHKALASVMFLGSPNGNGPSAEAEGESAEPVAHAPDGTPVHEDDIPF